jgi:hypothetical protein
MLVSASSLALQVPPAHAVLQRVGPPSTAASIGGYPTWYQDATGLALEFCDPKNQSEVEGGWCLLLAGDVHVVPETFPTAFFDEHFYFAAGASAPRADGGRALLTLAQEAAFAVGPPIPGDQVVFARIRVVLNPVAVTGTYRFIHPYGEEVIQGVAGDKIFFTEDVGINCPAGQFDCALNSRLGPFLLPSAIPGGAEMPPLTAQNPTPDTNPAHFGGDFAPTPYPGTGKAYIADPARVGPVTGSPLPVFTDSTGALRNHNIFRIEGPAGSRLGIDPATGALVDWVETTDFSLMGRVYTGALAGRVDVSRASYASNASERRLDVFASAFETTQARTPGQARPASILPQLTFFDAPCAGVVDEIGDIRPPYSAPANATEYQMFGLNTEYWGQAHPASIPNEVCVKDGSARDAAGNTIPAFFRQQVTDEVTITQAYYDPGAGTLTVMAASSDEITAPVLTLAYGTLLIDFTGGQIVVPDVIAPPAKVRVLSSAFGADERLVRTGTGTPAPLGVPVALNDTSTFLEDSGAQVLDVLTNDSNAAGGTVTVGTLPRLGTLVVNADGTLTYTSTLNASGSDTFTYTVTVGTKVSNIANVTLNITPVNDAPGAVNDVVNAIINTPIAINVLANDVDPDGAADLVAAVIVSGPTPAGPTISVNGGTVTFNSPQGGTYTFTYQAQDASGALSVNTGTVTVNVSGQESLTIAKAEYVRSKNLLKSQGSISPAAGQTITLQFTNSAGTVLGLAGTATVDALGNWAASPTVPLPTGATSLKATSSNGTARAVAISFK